MGADMTVAFCEITAPIEIARKRIKRMKKSDLEGVFESSNLLDDFTEDEEATPFELYAMRERLLAALEVAYSDQRRDTQHLYFMGRKFCFTGGMSWGDYPTEAFIDIDLIAESKVTDKKRPAPKVHDVVPTL